VKLPSDAKRTTTSTPTIRGTDDLDDRDAAESRKSSLHRMRHDVALPHRRRDRDAHGEQNGALRGPESVCRANPTGNEQITRGEAIVMVASATVPSWVIDGWYPNNPMGQKLAALHYAMPSSTEREREASKAYAPTAPTFGCTACGRFAFSKPTTCFWCAR
jgi:hypothetical protein